MRPAQVFARISCRFLRDILEIAMAPFPLRILLEHLIDYAGLFPPAGLAMRPAVENFETHRHSKPGWMLGRFIVPVSRLQEFEDAFEQLPPVLLPLVRAIREDARKWRLSALIGTDIAADLAAIQEFNRRHASRQDGREVFIDAIELKAQTPDDIRKAAQLVPSGLQTFFEIPISTSLQENIAAIKAVKKCAKVRTGGETANLFPSIENLARFLAACANAKLCFKATAGLHYPIRAAHRFTYEPDSPSGTMHGFVNVFLAASFMLYGMDASAATALLIEESGAAFRFPDHGVTWHNEILSNAQLLRARQSFCLSFGSCSFEEPVDDLRVLQLL